MNSNTEHENLDGLAAARPPAGPALQLTHRHHCPELAGSNQPNATCAQAFRHASQLPHAHPAARGPAYDAAHRRSAATLFRARVIPALLISLMLLTRLPTAACSACEAQEQCEERCLAQPIFSEIVSLPVMHPSNMRALAAGAPSFSQLGTSHLFNLPQNNIGQHPAVSLLKNLIIGSCNLKQYKDEQKSLLTDLDASKETITLLGGESVNDVPVTNNTCSAQILASEGDCLRRYTTMMFTLLADDQFAVTRTWGGGNAEMDSDLNASLTQLTSEYCEAHEVFSATPAIETTIAASRAEEAELIAVGCPCDIVGTYPLGGVEDGGFNITLTISGLDTRRPKATNLACKFNDLVEVPAEIVSIDSVQCLVPAFIAVMPNATNAVASGSAISGTVRFVPIDLIGSAFKVTRSSNGAKHIRYYKMPTFNHSRTMPGAFVTGDTPTTLRMITIFGANFNANSGGMLLRLMTVNSSSISFFAQSELTVIDTTLATGVMPVNHNPRFFRLEISISSSNQMNPNLDVWYYSGDIEYVERPLIHSIAPNSGPVMGGSLVKLVHTRVPDFNIGNLEAKLGQFFVPLTRTSEIEMTMLTPPKTVDDDPSWFFPGDIQQSEIDGTVFNSYESVQIFSVFYDSVTGMSTRTLYSRTVSNDTDQRFFYSCSQEEITSRTCCPVGTAGPGANNGSFCFSCEHGSFAPLVGSTACLTCPSNSVSFNVSANCTCLPGFESRVITHPNQTCIACGNGTYRNSSMEACSACPDTISETRANGGAFLTELVPSAARTECTPIFFGCPHGAYQPRNDIKLCCLLGHVFSDNSKRCIACSAGTFFNSSSRTCSACAAGSFSAESGLLNCSTCMNGTYSHSHYTSCLNCPINSSSRMGATSLLDCKCVNGTARTSAAEGPSVCASCRPGKFTVETDGSDAWCDECEFGKWSHFGSRTCTCAANWYQNGSYVIVNGVSTWVPEEHCDLCPKGTVSDMSNNTSDEGMLKGINACSCPAGFAAWNSRAGQSGCGHDPFCIQSCNGNCSTNTSIIGPVSTAPAALNNATQFPTTTPAPFNKTTPFPTTTPAPFNNTTPFPTTTPAPFNSGCADDHTWIDPVNGVIGCWGWARYNCHIVYPGYSFPSVVLSRCPKTCGICNDTEVRTTVAATTPAPTPPYSRIHWHAGSPMQKHWHRYDSPEPFSYCVDANECSATSLEDWLGSPYVAHRCHSNATCTNTYGSFTCDCNNGTYGDGVSCEPCHAFSSSGFASTSLSQCECMNGLDCGQEEAYYGTDTSNGTLLPELSHLALGGSLTFAFYVQPLTIGASAVTLSRGGAATSLPLSECNLVDVGNFVYAATGVDVNARAPGPIGANESLWNCTSENEKNLNASAMDGPQVILELGADAGIDVVRVLLDNTGHISYEVLPACSCPRCAMTWTSNVPLPYFVWSHVTVVQDEIGHVEIYLNGSVQGSTTSVPQYINNQLSSGTIPISPENRRPMARLVERRNCIVGGSIAQPATHHAFKGKLFDLSIWNDSLTAVAVSQMSARSPRPLLQSEALMLRRFSTICEKNATWRCIDVDECFFNSSSSHSPACSSNSACTNTWGSFTCSCMSGYYMSVNHSCLECVNASSRFGSTDVVDCKCNQGFTGPDGGQCVLCGPGSYKDVYGSDACSACPPHSFSGRGSSSLSNCTCNSGFTGPDGGSCQPCAAGTFKASSGAANCTVCPNGTYSTANSSACS